MVTLYGPKSAASGGTVPVISPVLVSSVNPGGRPTAPKVSVPLLLALIERETLSASVLVWSRMAAMLTGLAMVQVKFWLAREVPSVAVTVTLYGPLAAAPGATVPVIAPVLVLMLS